MAALYADENFPYEAVEALRRLGHDVLTASEAGQANQRIPDAAVLDFGTRMDRAVLTLNRWEFIGLHSRSPRHAGMLVCSPDPDIDRLANSIHAAIQDMPSLRDLLIRVNRPA